MIDPKELSIWREAFKKTGAIEIGNIFSQQTKSYIKGSAKLLYNKFNWEENFKNFNVKHSEKNSLYCKSMYCCHLGESILSFLTPLYSKISSACKAQASEPLPVSNFALTFPNSPTSIVSNQPHSISDCLSQ